MFLVAVKLAIVEALRAVWFDGLDGQETNTNNPQLDANATPVPRRITLEYPEEAEEWPTILVQVRPTVVEWMGIMPDEVIDAADESGRGRPDVDYSTTLDNPPPEAPAYKLIRQGRFEASCMLQILATTSMERDRMWDNLIKLLMMGRKKASTNNFFTTMENHDLVGITIMEGSIQVVGDSIGQGTPWDPEILSYEAAVEFDIIGTFFADEFTEDLVPLKSAEVFDYIPLNNENPPLDSDNQGVWKNPWG